MAQPGDTVGGAAGPAAHEAPTGPQGLPTAHAHDPTDGPCEAVRREDLSCPVCFETLTDPFVTACGVSAAWSPGAHLPCSSL